MPDHVTHRVQLFGSESDRRAFEAAHFVNGGLDFQTVIPQPPRVAATESSSSSVLWFFAITGTFPPSSYRVGTPSLSQYGWVPKTIKTAAELEPWLTKKEPTGRAKAEAMIACLRETGYEAWYEWCKENWGTRWNAYSCTAVEYKQGVSAFKFETAWSPPIPVFKELAKRWPGLIFDIVSYDEGDNFACVGHFNGRNDYRKVAVSPELYERAYGRKRPTDEEGQTMPSATRRASGAAFTLRPGESITFVLPVTPRTKKNSRVHAKVRGRTVPISSKAYRRDMLNPIMAWKASGVHWMLHYDHKSYKATIANLAQPLNCAAIFYRDANRGDAVGYYQALADALESAGVLSDDKWITQWDGSRLRKDANRPRIEVTLTALVGE